MGELVKNSTSGTSSRIVIILLFLAPALMALLPWDFGREMTPYRALMRGNSLSVTLVELAVVIAGMQKNISPLQALALWPKQSKIASCLLLIWVTFAAIFVASDPATAALGILTLLVHLLFALTITFWALTLNNVTRRKICEAIGWGVCFYCLIWFAAVTVQWPTKDEWISNVPGITNVRGIGFFAVAAVFAGIGILPDDPDAAYVKYMRALFFGTIGLGLAIWTGSRGALVAIIAAIFLLLILSKKWRLKLAAYLLCSVLLAGIASYPLPVENSSYGLIRAVGSSTDSNTDISSGRIKLWQDTTAKIAQRPLGGWGIDQFKTSGPQHTLGLKQPHNILLQILFSIGLIGMVLAALASVPLIRNLRWRDQDGPAVASWGCLIATLFFGLYDAAFYYAYPVMILLMAMAGIIHQPPSASGMSGSPDPKE